MAEPCFPSPRRPLPCFSPTALADLSSSLFPSVSFIVDPTSRRNRVQRFAALNLALVSGSLLGCSDSLKLGNCWKGLYWGCSGFLRRCKDWDSDGDFSLEAEILEFMQKSYNAEAFPTKEELVDAGRMDLAEAIIKQGGWLAYGWDLDEESRPQEGLLRETDIDNCDAKDGSTEFAGNESRASGVAASSSADHPQTAVSNGRSVGTKSEETGIEGILNRLEKERNNSLGLGFREKEDSISLQNNEDKDKWHHRTSSDAVTTDLEKSSRPSSLSSKISPHNGFQTKSGTCTSQSGVDDSRNSPKPEMWRSWIVQRTGFSDADFEDAEIAPSETRNGAVNSFSGDDIFKIRNFSDESLNGENGFGSPDGNANRSDIKIHLQHLESELSSVLQSLRSTSDKVTRQMDQKRTSDDFAKLSDAWEFQENEIMNAQDRLRSIHAKLAILEGKMALGIMDAHKIVAEKQKKIDNVRRALRVLKTTCVVWPHPAAEVLLAGSFDSWSTQRKMEKSSAGIFSLCLQLYPGKYEIKFIVDGEWKIDPLRPIVNNNGYDNNLLMVHGCYNS